MYTRASEISSEKTARARHADVILHRCLGIII